MKAALYVLPHGIEVVGEYASRGDNRYWRVRVRPHPFFEGVPVIGGGQYVRRSRAVLASKLGRALRADEHVHHIDGDRANDSPENLTVLSQAEHNHHHKTGAVHDAATKVRIADAMRRAYAEGRHSRPTITARDHQGRISQ